MADGGRIDQRHRDLEFMGRRGSGTRRSDGLQPSMERHDPAVSAKVIERLSKVGLLEAHLRAQFSRAGGREDSVSLCGQKTDELDAQIRPLWFLSGVGWIFPSGQFRLAIHTRAPSIMSSRKKNDLSLLAHAPA